MSELFADRFVQAGAGWVDLATGAPVRMQIAAAEARSRQLAWSDRCATLSLLRHPLLNTLVDYGVAGSRTFEAYRISPPVRIAGATAVRMLAHVVRFLESNGLPLTRQQARLVLREVANGRTSRGRSVGVVLQPRRVLDAIGEALASAGPGGGVSVVEIVGGDACGLRTLQMLTARLARVNGYVPICGSVLCRFPWLIEILDQRHVAVLLYESHHRADRARVAAFLARLGTASARRHAVLGFRRAAENVSGALAVEAMGVTAMNAMVFVDREYGPSANELFDAIRGADGRPGLLLSRLGAVGFEPHVSRAIAVHESPGTYSAVPTAPISSPVRRRRVSAALFGAEARAIRLAKCGRHSAALRLLERAARVLEARGAAESAAACACRLAWVLRDRGRSGDAFRQFERAQRLAGSTIAGIRAAVGLGVIHTDEARAADAEAALRAARAAADVMETDALSRNALVALARCLYWERRFDEAAASIEPLLDPEGGTVSAFALAARIRLAMGDPRSALAAAIEALRAAEQHHDPMELAVAARASALVRAALGDIDGARRDVVCGLKAAAAAHLPLYALRLRITWLRAIAPSQPSSVEAERLRARLRSSLERRQLPALLRAEIRSACAMERTTDLGHDGGLTYLQHLLEIAHAAADDHAAAEHVCNALCDRLRAATVQIVTAAPDLQVVARAGRPWQGDDRIARHALASGALATADIAAEPRAAAAAVRYGSETIGALVCRWTAGTALEPQRAAPLLRAGALAAAASVRSLLDRVHALPAERSCGDLLGSSPAADALREAVMRAARAPFPVLIEGESGSGKELVARAIHRLGARRERRLCTINCAAIADDLLEAELFGHARGAFTGAASERAGLFEEADGGTLFLDEIGELSPRAQAKLLRVLQDGEMRRVGENLPRRVDTRVIAATNRRLETEVEAGRFRADLRFRLDVIRIAVPPLRDHATDIPALAAHFWQDACSRVGSRATLAPDTLATLMRYDWPGNVRELQNAIASLAVHAPRRGRITPAALPRHLAHATIAVDASFEAAREDFERRFIRAALARVGGHRARAARVLGVTRQGLAKMMRRLHIDG